MEQFNGDEDYISDIINVIQTIDPGSKPTIPMDNDQVQPYVEILEQPVSKVPRFRYKSEGSLAGIPGVNSTPENKTFPRIRIVGYEGPAMVIVSCVTKDAPYRSHPHNLVGKKVCEQGICKVEIPSGNMVVTFSNLGIQCVTKKDIEEALRVRQELRVDPFRTGFEHKKHPNNIDLNAVRLCFQVFLEGSQKGKFNKPLLPVVSNTIYDSRKAMPDLVICELSHYSASIAGGIKMILLCEKVDKDDIEVWFFEEKDGQLVWEGNGEFLPIHVHKQTAISFRTPRYRTQQVEQPVQAYIQLRRPSDGATSKPRPFEMLPLGTGDRPKRPKLPLNPFTVPAKTKKHAENRPIVYNTNIGPPEQIAFGEPGTSTGDFTPQPQSIMQIFRSEVSPGQTSFMKCNPSPIQQPYQPNIQSIIQQDRSVTTDMELFNQLQLQNQLQLHQPNPNLQMLTRITPKDQGELNNIDAGNQSISYNIINAEPLERISFEEPGTSTGGFTLQPVRAFSQPPKSMQTFRSQVSPGQTSSSMKYNSSPIQQPYQPNIQPIIQQDISVTTDMQQFHQLQLPDQPQLHQPDPNLQMLIRKTPKDHGELNNIDTENQPISYNIINAEPLEQISFEEPGTSTGGFTMQPVRVFSQPPRNMQTLRSQVSPGQTSSMKCNPSPIQQPYQPNIQSIIQQDISVTTDMQQFHQLQLPDQQQLHQPDPNLQMLIRKTPKDHGELNNIDTENQPISYNIINAEPLEQISFEEPGTSTGGFTMQPVRVFSQPPRNMQTLRSQVSPGQTSSLMKCNSFPIQQPYQPNIQPIIQQDISVTTDMQQFHQLQLPDKPQLHQPDPNLQMLTRITPKDLGKLNNIGATEPPNLEDLSPNLSELSISDSV